MSLSKLVPGTQLHVAAPPGRIVLDQGVLWASARTTLLCCTVRGGCGRLGWGLEGTSAAQFMVRRHVPCPQL